MDGQEGQIFRAVFEGIVGLFRIAAFLLRFTIWAGRRLYGWYRAHNPRPFVFPPDARFEHTHIVAGTGHGKTQLLQTMILDDVEKVRAGQASIIVIDSQGDMIRNILTMASMRELSDRLVLIDPTDIDFPPALNLFDFGLDRMKGYDRLEQERLLNGAIDLYEYLFGALLGAELTQKQGVFFGYLARLMMAVPGATIKTLMDFLEDPEQARPYFTKLDKLSRHFLETQFFSSAYSSTRQQILTRLWGVVSNSILEKMFNNARNKVNLFSAMNTGSIILINTAKDLLKTERCAILGRFFIALICQAAQERATIAVSKRRSTYVYIDEAHDYFDERMENLLNQARKYMVGLVLAHQNLDQFDQKLRATVMSSTSIKLVGGLSDKDANAFAREMRCAPDFLQGMRKFRGHTTFAAYVKNHTPEPFPLSVPFGVMEDQPRLTSADYAELMRRNRQRYSAREETPPPVKDWMVPRPRKDRITMKDWMQPRAKGDPQKTLTDLSALGIGDPDVL